MSAEAPAPYVYVLVRTDIPLPAQLVQACHACLVAATRYAPPENAYLVVVSVLDEESLRRAIDRLAARAIDSVCYYENEWPRGYTAACTRPVSTVERRWLQKYPLWQPVEREKQPAEKIFS